MLSKARHQYWPYVSKNGVATQQEKIRHLNRVEGRNGVPPNYIDPRDGAYHLEHLERLRSDPMPVLSLSDLPGLVTFPSFHTAMGVIAIYCCRSIPLLSQKWRRWKLRRVWPCC